MTKPTVTLQARVTGALLLFAGILLSDNVVGWLLGPDKSSLLAQGVLALQGALMAAGILFLIMPAFLAGRPALQNLVTAGAGVAFVATLTGLIGLRVAPPIDYRYATYPEFTCAPTDAYCNTAAQAGLHDVSRYGKGTAVADMNGDGWVDIFAADAETRDNDEWNVSSFYINNGDGTFSSAELGIAADDLLSSWTASFADIDNDGDKDVVLTGGGYAGTGRLALYENRMEEEGRFVSITDAAGLGDLHDGLYRWWGVAWADYDNDGYLDFAVSRVYGNVILFHNNGDNTFTDVTEQMGITTTKARDRDGKNIVWFDYDYDGDQDLYFAGIFAHMFFRNDDGTAFTEVTDEIFAGKLPENWLYPKDAPTVFSAAAMDFDQDGFDDLYLGRQTEQELVLFNDGRGGFSAKGPEIGLETRFSAKNNEAVAFENTMGLGVGDLLDDGWPDVIIGSGDPVRADEDIVFCNRNGTFARCTELLRANASGPFRTRTHGIAFGDFNRDGHTDVFQSLGGHAPWDQKTGIDSKELAALFIAQPQSNHKTAVLTLEGVTVNRDALGARITVVAEETHYYTVRSTQAFQSQNDAATILALGSSDTAEVEVLWPDGTRDSVTVEAGKRYLLRQGESVRLAAN